MKDSDIYAAPGAAYRSHQIAEWSHCNTPIDPRPSGFSGNSRRHGDASRDVQKEAIDAIVEAGRAKGMSNDEIALTLAIARHESGFNPDAAAGPTSASGLGQFIDRTGAAYGLSEVNRWDLHAQAKALVNFTWDNIALARRRGVPDGDLPKWVYKFHHDGPRGEYGGMRIAETQVVPLIPIYRRYLESPKESHKEGQRASDVRSLYALADSSTTQVMSSVQGKKPREISLETTNSRISEAQVHAQLPMVSSGNSPSRSGGNVLINGRTAVHAGSGGTLTTVDVCRTKVGKSIVNIPYTNVARSSDAAQTAATVFINGHPVCHQKSIFALSCGDEPGDRLGVVSNTIKGKAEFITASPNVFIEGVPAVRQGDLMVSNNRNTAPMPLMQPGAAPSVSLEKLLEASREVSEKPFKLVVERAGASASLRGTLIAKSDGQIHEIPLGSTACDRSHCCDLVLDNLSEGRYQLVLHYADSRHGAYQIPLAEEVATVAKDQQCAQWDHVLIPVIPRTFLTAETDRLETSYPRCDLQTRTGWIYVYRDGRLWRELQVLPEGGVKDVNLTFEKGRNKRDATAGGDYLIALPYKINGKTPLIEMCYAEVQWDWARIDALGGMADEDPRQNYGVRVPRGQDGATAAQLRKARMQRIDLSEYPHFTRTEGPVGAADEFVPNHPNRKHIDGWRQSGLPVVYLHDPIGIVKDLASELYACKQRYLNGRNQAAEAAGDKYVMAEMVFQMGLDSPKAAGLVAMDELRDLLKWDRQIDHLHALEQAAVALGEYITKVPEPGVPDVHAAMKDYDEHANAETLLRGQLLSSELVGHLIYGEGRQYLSKSLDHKDHFLVGALNPSATKLKALAKDAGKIAEFIENLAAGTQADSRLREQVLSFLAKIVEQISDGELTLVSGRFDIAPVLAGTAAAGVKGGYLSSSFSALVRGRFDVTQWVVIKKGAAAQAEMTLGRSVDWLQKNHPLIKLNAVRLFAVLEVINLGHAVREFSKTNSGKEFVRGLGSFFALVSLGFTYLKDVKQIGAGWDNKELPKWQQHSLKMKRIVVASGAHGAGFIGNVIIVALAWNEAWAEYKKGNIGGAVAASVAALGATIMAASTTLGGVVEMNTLGARGFQGARAAKAAEFGRAKISFSRLQLSRVGAGSIAGIACILLGGLAMFLFSRTPLENFLARGPFGRDKDKRYNGSSEFESWRDDAIAEATLFNILFSPRLEPICRRLNRNQAMVEMRIHLPIVIEGKTRIDYELYGLNPRQFRRPAEKQLIAPSEEGTLTQNQDGTFTLTICYYPDSVFFFEAHTLVDLHGDGSRVHPVKIENAAIAGHAPVVVQFPEAVLS